ncbi:endo-beta-N-acetylglucosaminidase [Spiroplasma litorale]|uniref:Endo-beta-N-acetylglucosaminidase n=1 Tax=Spiroplasma litorale TaxID=216942 RepID=A0A0K1W221_9MOLU|nr:hypothetical protein [Spiroplasma litorale]AKX34365.1 endo-beta-N-acetylglucosaminidase [Spiroplasma litorale]
MKKLMLSLNAMNVVLSASIIAVSCANGNISNSQDNNNMKPETSDYNWSKSEPYFEGFSTLEKYDIPNVVNKSMKLDVKNTEKYMDYKKYPTSYRVNMDIEKQAPTGVPLNSHFMPNGNKKGDIMTVDPSEENDYINSLLDWDLSNDLDAKYNVSRIELQKSTKVAKKWVNSQNKNIKELNIANIIDEVTANHSTIVGKNASYSRGINNYQYNDVTVAWAGNAGQGIIVPPAAEIVQKAHLNGTKILGNIFLDGYHGLKKEMLDNFLAKDNEGNYLIIDKLIQLCTTYKFDGWFWNNEPNGGYGNGKILDYKIVIEMLKQWNDKVKKSDNQDIKKLIMFTYKDAGHLSVDKQTGKPQNQESSELHDNSDYFVQDFGNTIYQSRDYVNKDKEKLKNIFNIYNTGVWTKEHKKFYNKDNIGSYDAKRLAYAFDPKVKKYDNYEDTYEFSYPEENVGEDAISNSIAMFSAHNPYENAVIDSGNLEGITEMERDIYKLVYANYYDEMMYTGRNKVLSDNDKGILSYDYNFKPDENGISFGYGNLVQENTVLNDENDVFFTNFSTGNGSKFASLEANNEISILDNYPWSNANIGDVQPTYKWKIINEKTNNHMKKEEVTGFYDYYNPYLKGNSISLGSGFNKKGEIKDFNLDKGTDYDWWIMGTNYSKNKNKKVEFMVKTTGNVEATNNSLKIIYDTDKPGENPIEASNIKLSPAQNGWTKVSAEINSEATISKIGIKFKGGTGTIKVGQLEVSNANKDIKQINSDLMSISSELHIKRDSGINNYRLNFNNFLKEDDLYTYYEVFAEKEGKIVKLAESNKNDYYVKNINWETNNFYLKVVNNLTKKVEWTKIEL